MKKKETGLVASINMKSKEYPISVVWQEAGKMHAMNFILGANTGLVPYLNLIHDNIKNMEKKGIVFNHQERNYLRLMGPQVEG